MPAIFEAINPTLTVHNTVSRGRALNVSFPYIADLDEEARAIRRDFKGFVTERAPIADQFNVITNPSFERDLAGWSVSAGGHLERIERPDIIWPFTNGNYVGRVYGETDTSISVFSPSWEVVPGEHWSARAEVNILDELTSISWFLEYLSGTTPVSTGFVVTNGGPAWWTPEQTNQTIPTFVDHARLVVRLNATPGVTDTMEFLIDSAIAVKTTTTLTYFDGDSFHCDWVGTPHASQSYSWH